MKKVIAKNYVITTDSDDLSQLLSFLEKYKIRAYNYKVRYISDKLSTRIVLSENVILSIENLPLDEAEKLIPKEEISPSSYYLEFHNVPPSNISFFNSLSFTEAEFHVFSWNILCKIEGFRCKVKELEVLQILSQIFPAVKRMVKPFNMNFLVSKDRESLICEILLKSIGVRNTSEINNCKITGNKVIYKDSILFQW
ncbi:hypothetical protein [Sulfurisphaera ohwakuensis]|uniref:hypothetical protein n=1 Tax=Sulfurisphaera ohwakuensis TaxID=69656 RepID=UPI0036F2AF81